MSSDRTEKATPKRREDARKKGQIARGAKLPAAIGFFAALMVMRVTGADWLQQARHCFVSVTASTGTSQPLTPESVHKLFLEAAWSLALLVMPIMSAVFVAGVAGSFAQGGFTIAPNALTPKWERMNPVANLKRVFSKQALVDMIKSLVELGMLSLICYGVLMQAIADAPHLLGSPAARTLSAIGALLYELGFRIGGVLVVFAAIDYGYKWYAHEKSLRMTKQEVKDEFRSQEGDPLVKGQRRRAARALIQRRLTVEVPRADVVITNPTHYAVALLYDHKKSAAPVVVAKGADLMAKRIRKIAREHEVMIIENPPLARVLYRDVEVGQFIPPEFFRAVAEILAYVYHQRQAYQK
jgi:flagellar biosynthesis protein FlhB